jgi:hypothetical protein
MIDSQQVPLQRLIDEVHRADAAVRALRDILRVLPEKLEPTSELAYIARITKKALLLDRQRQIDLGHKKKTAGPWARWLKSMLS